MRPISVVRRHGDHGRRGGVAHQATAIALGHLNPDYGRRDCRGFANVAVVLRLLVIVMVLLLVVVVVAAAAE